MSYRQLLQSLHGDGRLGETPVEPLPSELELQALWFSGAFGRHFTDHAGTTVHIVQFGEWNRGPGPDFLHCVIARDGEHHEGAIELDTRPSDWEAHGHGADPAFEQVVLHVVFRAAATTTFTRTAGHREVPQTLIPDTLLAEVLQRPTHQTAIARPGRCLTPLADMAAGDIASLLREAAEHRAQLKAARLLKTADAHGRDLALFHAVAETLGYRANTLPMKLLAQRMPLTALREDPADIEALLFGAAGFLSPELHEKAPPDTREHLRSLWETWWKHRGRWESRHPLPWQLGGQRPANHPHRRIATLAALAREWPAFRHVALARPFAPKPLIACLQKLDDPFWSHRHTLSSAPAVTPVALFGKSHATELLANHLIPLALTEDHTTSYETYLALPAGSRNEKVRRCAIRLFGSEDQATPWLKKAAHHQALLQIYHDFCLEDLSDCTTCPFPEQLKQWSSS